MARIDLGVAETRMLARPSGPAWQTAAPPSSRCPGTEVRPVLARRRGRAGPEWRSMARRVGTNLPRERAKSSAEEVRPPTVASGGGP